LTPGFVTDGVGLLLFVPPLRSALRAWATHFLVHSGRVQTWSTGPAVTGARSSTASTRTSPNAMTRVRNRMMGMTAAARFHQIAAFDETVVGPRDPC